MRKAFTLIELLVMVTILPFVMVAISGVYATFIRDIPRTTRVLQENTMVLDVLEQIRRDVEGAIGLPEQFEGQPAGERTLLIEQPGRVIRYQLEDGRMVRTPFVVTPSGVSSDALTGTLQTGPPSEERLWRMRDAVITWRLWVRDDRAYAIEIHSHVKQWVAGILRKKLANTYIFFVRGLADANVVQLAWRGLPALASPGHNAPVAARVQGQDALATAGVLHGLGTFAKEREIR